MANILTPEQLALVCAKAGFHDEYLVIAVAVALAESGGNALAIGDNGMSFGLFQINAHAHPTLIPGWQHDTAPEKNIANCTAKVAWYNPFTNAGFAYKISGGKNFKPWSVYIHETYKKRMELAKTGVAKYLANPDAVPAPKIVAPTLTSTPTKPYLRQGSTGSYVKILQEKLNSAGYTPKLEVDGIFGPLTLAAVKWFQAKMQIDVDGIVGPITWGKIDALH